MFFLLEYRLTFDYHFMNTLEHQLSERLGRIHARQRLGIENDHKQRAFGKGLNFFHPENWYSSHTLIRLAIQLVGLYGRGQRNARNLQVKHNTFQLAHLPEAFQQFRILYLCAHRRLSRSNFWRNRPSDHRNATADCNAETTDLWRAW